MSTFYDGNPFHFYSAQGLIDYINEQVSSTPQTSESFPFTTIGERDAFWTEARHRGVNISYNKTSNRYEHYTPSYDMLMLEKDRT